MVVVNYTLELSKISQLNAFNDVNYIAFGSGTTTPISGQTSLVNELLRVKLGYIEKDTDNYTYNFVGRVPISQLNSSTIYEIGLFNAISGGNMACRIVLNTGLTKTSDDELLFRIIIKVNSINK